MSLARNGVLYVLLIAAAFGFLREIVHIAREWWRDVQLHRAINRRGDKLLPGWSVEGTERFRGRLGDARDTKAKNKRPAA